MMIGPNNDISALIKIDATHQDRTSSRESRQLEFKKSYGPRDWPKYFKTMAAFANNMGGYIVFGVGDRPRELIGLSSSSLEKFEKTKVERFDSRLSDCFSPAISWDSETCYFDGKPYGIIYVYESENKPVICHKSFGEDQDCIREGDIYFRYGGRTKRIAYPEIYSIIQQARLREQQKWSNLMSQMATIGATNAAIFDISSGEISGIGGSVIIDEDILHEISFIKEGSFNETDGRPTLKLIGEVKNIESGKAILGTKPVQRVSKSIDSDAIISSFLSQDNINDGKEFVRAACFCSTAMMPVYYYISRARMSLADAIEYVKRVHSRGTAKIKLLTRLQGKRIPVLEIPTPR